MAVLDDFPIWAIYLGGVALLFLIVVDLDRPLRRIRHRQPASHEGFTAADNGVWTLRFFIATQPFRAYLAKS